MVQYIPGLGIKAFTLEARLGKGASGEVWSASEGAFKVALKLLKPELVSANNYSNLRDQQDIEVEALRRLEPNPHLPVLYDWDLDYGQPYLAMQLIEGDSYDRLIRAGKLLQLPLEQRLGIIHILAETLATMHEARLLHRDIKPANVVGIDLPLLLDYRISLNDDLIDWSQLSPKSRPYQPYDGVRDQAGDMYSFGLLAYEILLGRHAIYQPEDYRAINSSVRAAAEIAVQRLDSGQWRAPSRLPAVEIPPDLRNSRAELLDAVFLRALGSHDQRYPDARAFASALESVIKTEPEPADEGLYDGPALTPNMPHRVRDGQLFAGAAVSDSRPTRPAIARPSAQRAMRSVAPVELAEDDYFEPESLTRSRGSSLLLTLGVALAVIVLIFVISFFAFGNVPGTTASPSPTASATSSATASATSSQTAAAALIVASATPTVSATMLPPSPTATVASATPVLSATPIPSPTSSSSPTPSPSPTRTATITLTNTPLPTNTATHFPTNTPIPPEAYIPSEDLVENLLALRLAINANPYGCILFNRFYDHFETRMNNTEGGSNEYVIYGPLIIDAMGTIRRDYCLPQAMNPGPLPDSLRETNSALDLLLWEIVLELRASF